MPSDTISDLLSRVRKPSRYLGGEINSRKKAGSPPLSLALCFPDIYEIGTSHFGIQIMYHILNRRADIGAERVFAPGLDMAAALRQSGRPLTSLESGTPLAAFDIVGFSLLYELNYTNLLFMLDLAGLPFYAVDRDDTHPLLIAGGPCTFNPEPVADFFDAMVIGDGEAVIEQMADIWLKFRRQGRPVDKAQVRRHWSQIPGVYIPSDYNVTYDEQGNQQLRPRPGAPETVTRAFAPELLAADFPDQPVVPFGKPIHDRLRLEIARGCTRGCRFCQAGMIYRPVRERPLAEALALTDRSLAATGYEDISLLSLSTGDYSALDSLLTALVERYAGRHIALSIPSFRAGTLSDAAMKQILSLRKTGFTMAPEAGSQRLRDVINKNVTEAEIITTVENAYELGWNLIKTYFMIGLPAETPADDEAIVELVQRLAAIGRKKGKNKKINVSVAVFVPKAHTPFQWEPQLSVAEARQRIVSLKRRLSSRQIGFKWQDPEVSLLEGVFSRGDRRLAKVLKTAYQLGCRFDGWSDTFDFEKWQQAAASCNFDLEEAACRPRVLEEPLPWDHIRSGVSREFLVAERERSVRQQATPDCRDGNCQQCGVCDFRRIYPRLAAADSCQADLPPVSPPPFGPAKNGSSPPFKAELIYSKMDAARFFGHLEFVNIFLRALNRAGLPLWYSEGFHPKPRVSFGDPLPVGMESEAETVHLLLTRPLAPEEIQAA
ncbi:MAG: TIGR03960 family B12-binding radical SAM protein, partial [Desulfosudaceae bacterium]